MKHFISLFLFCWLCLSLQAQTYSVSTKPKPQRVLLEEFTGVRCGYCPDGHAMGEKLKLILGDRVSLMAIHCGHFAAVSKPDIDYRVPTGEEIGRMLGAEYSSFPNGSVNRHNWNGDNDYVFGRWSWLGRAKEVTRQTAPVNLWANASYDALTRRMSIEVEGFFTANEVEQTQRLSIMLVQNHIVGYQNGSPYNEYEHEHMLRAAVNGTYGEVLEHCRPKTFFSRKYTYEVPEVFGAIPVKPEDLELVVFVTGEDAKGVKNVITIKPEYRGEALPLKGVIRHDKLGITTGYGFSFVNFVLENRSNVTLTSALFDVSLNGETVSQEWQGEIPAFGCQEVRLPVDWSETKVKQNVTNICLKELNGEKVESAVLTDVFDCPDLVVPTELLLRIQTTPTTEDNTYTLYDMDRHIVQQLGQDFESNQQYEEVLNLKPGQTYCLEVTNAWCEGFRPSKPFIELCTTDGNVLLSQPELMDFGYRCFFRTTGKAEPDERFTLQIERLGEGYISVNNERIRTPYESTFAKNERIDIGLEPMAPNYIEGFKVDGNDCKELLNGGHYVFDIEANTSIEVCFDYFHDTAIAQAEQGAVSLRNEQGHIVMSGLEAGQTVSVYTLAGKLSFSFEAQSPTLHFDLPKGQGYLVKVGSQSFKVVL